MMHGQKNIKLKLYNLFVVGATSAEFGLHVFNMRFNTQNE